MNLIITFCFVSRVGASRNQRARIGAYGEGRTAIDAWKNDNFISWPLVLQKLFRLAIYFLSNNELAEPQSRVL